MAQADAVLDPASSPMREPHRVGARMSEIILGGQDGLVNVLGIILGLAAATNDTRIVIIGGLAATFAESISMAAVAYTSTLADLDFYRAEVERERREIKEVPHLERQEIREIFAGWGFESDLLEKMVDHIATHEDHWVEIMMAHELNLQPIDPKGVVVTAALVGFSAIVGSLIPLVPFFFLPGLPAAILGVILAAVTLFAVGVVKARMTVGRPARSGLQMMLIGILSALAGYGVGVLLGSPVP
jgi:VIT1/CCC1 family predicted Fe2+/Mn2+ transporter